MRNWIATLGAVALGTLATGACGDSMKSALPTAPSAVASSAVAASTAESGGTSLGADGTVIREDANSPLANNGTGMATGMGMGTATGMATG